MFSVFTSAAIFFIDSTNSGTDFFESPFSIAVRTTRQSFDSPSRIWFGAISSTDFRAFFRALNFMKSQWRFRVFMLVEE